MLDYALRTKERRNAADFYLHELPGFARFHPLAIEATGGDPGPDTLTEGGDRVGGVPAPPIAGGERPG
jgi:hypothetical protein